MSALFSPHQLSEEKQNPIIARRRKAAHLPIHQCSERGAAGRLVDQADLTDYDLSGMKRTRFEFENKSARVTMRLPASLLNAVKARTQACDIPYQRMIREALEDFVTYAATLFNLKNSPRPAAGSAR
jgi:predicted DNA binding CopG/RHH family protein